MDCVRCQNWFRLRRRSIGLDECFVHSRCHPSWLRFPDWNFRVMPDCRYLLLLGFVKKQRSCRWEQSPYCRLTEFRLKMAEYLRLAPPPSSQ